MFLTCNIFKLAVIETRSSCKSSYRNEEMKVLLLWLQFELASSIGRRFLVDMIQQEYNCGSSDTRHVCTRVWGRAVFTSECIRKKFCELLLFRIRAALRRVVGSEIINDH